MMWLATYFAGFAAGMAVTNLVFMELEVRLSRKKTEE